MKRAILLLLAAALLAIGLSGCAVIDGQTRDLIDRQAILAKQVAENAQGQADCPPTLKEYLKADAASWQYFSDFAHNRHPAPLGGDQ